MTTTKAIARRQPQQPTGAQALAQRDPLALGKVMAASGYFADAKDENQAVVKVIAGQELGVGSLAALTGIHIIEGKPVVGANVMATLVKRHPLYHYTVVELDDKTCSIDFFEKGADSEWQLAGRSTFTWEDAVRAGVTGKGNWKKYPKNMLFARALSDGVKFYAPDATSGSPVYTPDQLDVQVDEESGDVAGDIPPVQAPDSVATSQEQPAAAAPAEPTEPSITAKQKTKLWALADEAGIKANQPLMRALILWATGATQSDRIPKSKVDAVFDAVKDHEGAVAAIHDAANDGDQLAREIVQRFFGDDDGDPGPEPDQPELS